MSGDLFAQSVTLAGRELFGVVEFPVAVFFWKDHGCREYRSCEAASSGLVAAGFFYSVEEIWFEHHALLFIAFMMQFHI
jgi:hypothetical protein